MYTKKHYTTMGNVMQLCILYKNILLSQHIGNVNICGFCTARKKLTHIVGDKGWFFLHAVNDPFDDNTANSVSKETGNKVTLNAVYISLFIKYQSCNV